MLFDTPMLNVSAAPVADSAASTSAKKRKRSNSGGAESKADLAQGAAVNLEKLMKTMKNIDTSSGGAGAKGTPSKGGNAGEGKNKKSKKGKEVATELAPVREERQRVKSEVEEQTKPKSKSQKKREKAAARASRPSQPSESAASLVEPSSPKPSSSKEPFRHSAPNVSTASQASAAPQTAMQSQLRAKLAGGKFRMLNETLYTTSGADAWTLMKEEGAFDDYHAGFRSQASNWPVHPLSVIANSLLSTLPPNSLVADFGCGDAALARTLCPSSAASASGPSLRLKLAQPKLVAQKALKVLSFDLVSQNPYVVEAECSSVPLPGSPFAIEGQMVDAVVCCLSLMGTDWINMVREARRVLKENGILSIAEVTSRFDKTDDFVKLVESVGFESTGKDDSNSHFVLFEFRKASTSAEQLNESKKADNSRKGTTLLKPCIYKKR
ncbi:hypothetical protein JCM10212_005933 [Sporobolomyces blumeae]